MILARMSALRSLPAVACAAVLAALLSAQDQELPLPAPALRVHTRDLGLVEKLQDVLVAPRHDYALPADTGYCVFTVRADGNVEQTTSRGLLRPGTHAELFLKPKVALGAWEHELAEVRRLLQPRLDALCVQFGYPQGFGKRLWSDAQTALAQCSGIYLRIDGDLRAPAAKGVTCTLQLVPEPDTALH